MVHVHALENRPAIIRGAKPRSDFTQSGARSWWRGKLFAPLGAALARRSPAEIYVICLLITCVIGVFEYLDQLRLSMVLLHIIPISIAAWYAGPRIAFLLNISSIPIWYAAIHFKGDDVNLSAYALNRFVLFTLLILVVARLKTLTDNLEELAQRRAQALLSEMAEREILDLQPDLAIVDMSLNGSSGFDLIRTLHREMPGLRILALSMHDEKLYAERCIRAGAHGYLMKRESSRRIVDAVRDVLKGKRFVSDQMAAVFLEKFMDGNVSQDAAMLSRLSDRELEVFNLLGQGLASRKIATSLNLNLKTVQAYCARIKQKLHFTTATELLREATRWHHDSSNG